MKQVYMARDRVDAERACSALRGAGIAAVVVGDLVVIPSATFPSIWVPDEQADAAAAAWAEIEERHPT